MMDPIEARAAARAAVAADPQLQAHVRRVADRYRRRHPAPPVARTAAQQWHDFHAAEAAHEREQERHR